MAPQENDQQNENKPVGYGSSIQSSGHGNKSRPQNEENVDSTEDPNMKQEKAKVNDQAPKTT